MIQCLRKGFNNSKADRIGEWVAIRKEGFIRSWLRSTIFCPIMFPLISVIAAFIKQTPVLDAVLKGFVVGIALMVIIGIADGFYWLVREREWRKAEGFD